MISMTYKKTEEEKKIFKDLFHNAAVNMDKCIVFIESALCSDSDPVDPEYLKKCASMLQHQITKLNEIHRDVLTQMKNNMIAGD